MVDFDQLPNTILLILNSNNQTCTNKILVRIYSPSVEPFNIHIINHVGKIDCNIHLIHLYIYFIIFILFETFQTVYHGAPYLIIILINVQVNF
jgi:hypothetical protein